MKRKFVSILSENLTRLREESGLDQGQFGAEIGVSRQTVNAWEAKVTIKLTSDHAEKVAQVLGVPIEVLTDVKKNSGADLTQVLLESIRGINLLVKDEVFKDSDFDEIDERRIERTERNMTFTLKGEDLYRVITQYKKP